MTCQHQEPCASELQHLLLAENALTRGLDTIQYYHYLRHTPFNRLLADTAGARNGASEAEGREKRVLVTSGAA